MLFLGVGRPGPHHRRRLACFKSMASTPPLNCFKELLTRGYHFHAFISWPHQIQEQGRKLVQDLAESLEDRLKNYGGGNVFFDLTRLKEGYQWDGELRKSLCRSGVTIVIVVDSFFDSAYCRTEWA